MSNVFNHRLTVRFRDCDSLGHVNNAVYLTYLEETRFAHWRSLGGELLEESGGARGIPGVILVRVEIDYRAQAHNGDALEIRMQVTGFGRSSFTYEYEIVDQSGRQIATAKSVMVMFDYETQKAVPIPEAIHALLTR